MDYRIRKIGTTYLPEIKPAYSLPYSNDGFIPLDSFRRTSFKVDFTLNNIGSILWASFQLLDFVLHRINASIDNGVSINIDKPKN